MQEDNKGTSNITDKTKSVMKSTAVMSACTLCSRITGFIRTWAMAFALGNTALAAGFNLANNMPNQIFELVAGGALAAAFVPVYHIQRNRLGRKYAQEYGCCLLSFAIVALGSIALLASIFAPQVMHTQSLFNSTSDSAVEYAIWFFRFFSFQMIFYGISGIFNGLLNAEREFLWPALSSVFMNIVTIITFLAYPFLSGCNPFFSNVWLAVGTVLAIAIMAFVQIPALKKIGFTFKFSLKMQSDSLHETIHLAFPAIINAAVMLVSLSFLNSCALRVAENGPAAVTYAWMWYQFPYGVLGVALSTALFTEMSMYASKHDWGGYAHSVRAGLKTTFLLIIPMAVLLFVCSTQLIGLYSAGKFTAADVQPIANLLRVWSFNLPFYAAFMYITNAFSALKDMKTVALANMALSAIQILLYLLFTGCAFSDFSLGLSGLAFADIIKYIILDVVLLLILRRRCEHLHLFYVFPSVIKIVLASTGGLLIGFTVNSLLAFVINMETIGGAFVGLIATGSITLVGILIVARQLKISELNTLLNELKVKFRRA